jgi:hypothetical protein
MITLITNHASQALERLREQYKNKPQLIALINSWHGQIQELEEVLFGLTTSRSIETSIGYQLDLLGQLLNKSREGRSDEEYRIVLLAKVAQNISRGTPEDVIGVFKILTSSSQVQLSDGYNGEVYLLADHTLTQDQINTILREMDSVVPAGVRVNALGSFDPDDSFAYAGTDVAKGFSSIYDLSKGGKLATIRRGNEKKFAFDGSNTSLSGFGSVYDSDLGGTLVAL